ncbi:MAG: mechanosensitive ion channel [Nanoarchaeota archaeon]|nr:mechanosensitive ion channel [Nanoarchaeota archaeon]
MVFEELLQTQVISILQFTIVIAIGVIVTKMVTDAATDFFKRKDIKKMITKMGYEEPIIELITMVIKYVFYFITFIIALSQFGFAKVVLDAIIILIALFIIIIILFSLKDFVPNAAAGIYLSTFKSIKKGDVLAIGGYMGKVVDINLVSITLEDETGRLTIIPNSNVVKKEIIKIPKKARGGKK